MVPAGGAVLWVQVRMLPSRIRGDRGGEIAVEGWMTFAPFSTTAVPKAGQPFTVRGITLRNGLTVEEVDKRRDLLGKLDSTFRGFEKDSDLINGLDRFSQPPSAELQTLYDARAAGVINSATPLDSPGNQLQVLGNPKWKATTTLTWTGAHLQAGSSLIYTGSTLDTNFLSNDGMPWHVASATIVNLYVQYSFSLARAKDQLRIKIGARNLFDRSPPLQSDGFNGALYNAYGRYVYFNVGASF